jgi:hypothetical protein
MPQAKDPDAGDYAAGPPREAPYGIISARSPRYPAWRLVFGSATLPLTSWVPCRALKPDGTEAEFYKCDLGRLTAAQRCRLVVHLVNKTGMPQSEIEAALNHPDHGLPILAEDLTVPIPLSLFL